jgi:hypothetical protein
VHNNLRSAASDHNTPEISGCRHTGTTLKADEQEHERISAHAAQRAVSAVMAGLRAVKGRSWQAGLLRGIIGQMTDRAMVSRRLAGYEAAGRAPGTEGLAGIFTDDASYRQSPYDEPVAGLDAIRRMRDEERVGPDEVFTLATEILVVDGPAAVVRAEVCYGDPPRREYRDLWTMQLGDDGRCSWFEEWPCWPARPCSARDESL